MKSNSGRKVHLYGKWKDFLMISHKCSLSHRGYLTAVLSVKVRFLNCRAKKIKVITNLLLLLLVYRPPNQRVGDFVSKHNDLLAKISRENKICFIMGDFNLNLINFQHHPNTCEFLDGLHSNMFFPMITRPTRITSHTATLVDNIFAKNFLTTREAVY